MSTRGTGAVLPYGMAPVPRLRYKAPMEPPSQVAAQRSKRSRVLDLVNGVDESSLSRLARGLIGSEVLRIAAEVRALVAAGKPVCNLTVGDFDAREFAPPPRLLQGIGRALAAGHTNYPPSNGVLELRQAVTRFCRREFVLEYPVESVLVAGGPRPL